MPFREGVYEMSSRNRYPQRAFSRASAWLTLAVAFTAVAHAVAQSGTAPAQKNVPPAVLAPGANAAPALGSSGAPLGLVECRAIARSQQPRIAVQHASLAAAEDACRALEALKFAVLVDPELPVRRRQAAMGINAAIAGVDQAEHESDYAVTRTYFSVLYAREQERVARDIVDRLSSIHQAVKQQVESGARDASEADVRRAEVYLRMATAKKIEAAVGVRRATNALLEAMGFGCDGNIEITIGRLPELDAHPIQEEIIALALARRGELIRSNVLADVACLEVEAQNVCVAYRKETFAAGTDIHAVLIPQGIQNTEYRPGAVAPEYPTMLAGSRQERVRHAQSLYARARSAADVARNLIVLDAKDAYLRWEEAARQISEAKQGADSGEYLANELSKAFTSGLKVKVEEVVSARVLGAQARASYNEAVFHQLLALADLERVTAGGFNARLAEASIVAAQPANDQK
jgi:hypothetical protein